MFEPYQQMRFREGWLMMLWPLAPNPPGCRAQKCSNRPCLFFGREKTIIFCNSTETASQPRTWGRVQGLGSKLWTSRQGRPASLGSGLGAYDSRLETACRTLQPVVLGFGLSALCKGPMLQSVHLKRKLSIT